MAGFAFVLSQYWYLVIAALVLGLVAGWLSGGHKTDTGHNSHG